GWPRLGSLWLSALLRDYSSSLRDAASSRPAAPRVRPLAGPRLSVFGRPSALAARALRSSHSLGPSVPGARRRALGRSRCTPAAPAAPAGATRARLPARSLRGASAAPACAPELRLVAVAGAEPLGAEAALYRARCPHLRPRPWDRGAFLDLGLLGRWWLLEAALRDCDINEEEFGQLPEPLRRMEPGMLRSERNERLHRERLRAVVLSEADIGEDGE
uniref:Uncharacterized protein n=1 Tax=Geospiza parvula TaxID=87175 RepID=A0A8U8BUR8_GEOPR